MQSEEEYATDELRQKAEALNKTLEKALMLTREVLEELDQLEETHKIPRENIKAEKAERKLSKRQEMLKALEEAFSNFTGLPLPPRRTIKQKKSAAIMWWEPLYEIAEMVGNDLPAAIKLIENAVAHSRNSNLILASPKSILNVSRSIAAQGNGGKKIPQIW